MELAKPDVLFDRDAEWAELASFVANRSLGATLAIVYGRRRQGKTLLLELLAEASGDPDVELVDLRRLYSGS